MDEKDSDIKQKRIPNRRGRHAKRVNNIYPRMGPPKKDRRGIQLGRRCRIDRINHDKIKTLAIAGWTNVKIAEFFGISPNGWQVYLKNHPVFFAQVDEWRKMADANVARSMYDRAKGFRVKAEKVFCSEGRIVRAETTEYYPPDPRACEFWLTRRQPEVWGAGSSGGDTHIINIINSFNLNDQGRVDAAMAIFEDNMRTKQI